MISIIALTVASISLCWNIYRDVFFKRSPQVKVKCSLKALIHSDDPRYKNMYQGTIDYALKLNPQAKPPLFFVFQVFNGGPGNIIIESCIFSTSKSLKPNENEEFGKVFPHEHTPKLIEPENSCDYIVDFSTENIQAFKKFNYIGVLDKSGNAHITKKTKYTILQLSLIHKSEPTRPY